MRRRFVCLKLDNAALRQERAKVRRRQCLSLCIIVRRLDGLQMWKNFRVAKEVLGRLQLACDITKDFLTEVIHIRRSECLWKPHYYENSTAWLDADGVSIVVA